MEKMKPPLLVLVAIGLIGFVGRSAAQQVASNPSQVYQSLLDRVFPWPKIDLRTTHMTISMRFVPSVHPESLIILRLDDKGLVTADYSKVAMGINTFLSSAIRNQKLDGQDRLETAVLNQALGFQQRTYGIEEGLAKNWLDDFWDSLARSTTTVREDIPAPTHDGSTVVVINLDGTEYELQLSTDFAAWTVMISDNEIDSKINGRAPIVRWMNSVRTALDQMR